VCYSQKFLVRTSLCLDCFCGEEGKFSAGVMNEQGRCGIGRSEWEREPRTQQVENTDASSGDLRYVRLAVGKAGCISYRRLFLQVALFLPCLPASVFLLYFLVLLFTQSELMPCCNANVMCFSDMWQMELKFKALANSTDRSYEWLHPRYHYEF
jgi:hypothetical protein